MRFPANFVERRRENAGRSGKQDFNAGCQRNKVHRQAAQSRHQQVPCPPQGKEAAKAENSNTEDTATKNNTDKSEKTQESAGAAAEETDSVKNTDIKGETQVTVETPTLENAQNATQQAVYTPIDIRL